MIYIKIAIVAFILLETTNVIALYFFPDSKLANSIGIFDAWEKTKSDPEIHNFARYLVNWVAGTKLIFIMLLIVILFTGSDQTLIFTAVALVISIASFFWRLFPSIRKMDRDNQIDPKRYSTVLGIMIFAFIMMFMIAISATVL
jgi:hypothetical protein